MYIESQTHGPRRGFTQADLNALLSILALLVILVSAGLKSARVAGTIGCQRNLGVMGAEMVAIAQNTGRYRFAGLIGYSNPKFREIYHGGCPNAARPPDWQNHNRPYTSFGFNRTGLGMYSRYDESLGMVGNWSESADGRPGPGEVALDEVVAPSRMIAWGDAIVGEGNELMDGGAFGRRPIDAVRKTLPTYRNAARRIQRRHSGHANVAFADGHVESLSLHTLFADDSVAALRLWNRDHKPHRERLNTPDEDRQTED